MKTMIVLVALAVLCGCGGADSECTSNDDCPTTSICFQRANGEAICNDAEKEIHCCNCLSQSKSYTYASERECAADVAAKIVPDGLKPMADKCEDQCYMLQ